MRSLVYEIKFIANWLSPIILISISIGIPFQKLDQLLFKLYVHPAAVVTLRQVSDRNHRIQFFNNMNLYDHI